MAAGDGLIASQGEAETTIIYTSLFIDDWCMRKYDTRSNSLS